MRFSYYTAASSWLGTPTTANSLNGTFRATFIRRVSYLGNEVCQLETRRGFTGGIGVRTRILRYAGVSCSAGGPVQRFYPLFVTVLFDPVIRKVVLIQIGAVEVTAFLAGGLSISYGQAQNNQNICSTLSDGVIFSERPNVLLPTGARELVPVNTGGQAIVTLP